MGRTSTTGTPRHPVLGAPPITRVHPLTDTCWAGRVMPCLSGVSVVIVGSPGSFWYQRHWSKHAHFIEPLKSSKSGEFHGFSVFYSLSNKGVRVSRCFWRFYRFLVSLTGRFCHFLVPVPIGPLKSVHFWHFWQNRVLLKSSKTPNFRVFPVLSTEESNLKPKVQQMLAKQWFLLKLTKLSLIGSGFWGN